MAELKGKYQIFKQSCTLISVLVVPKAVKMIKFVQMRILKLMGNLLSCHVGWETNAALTTLLADSFLLVKLSLPLHRPGNPQTSPICPVVAGST